MLVQNHNDLTIANKIYSQNSTMFGYAGRNDEYGQYWRKLIKAKWSIRNQSRWNKKIILSWVKFARTADYHAKNEKRWKV
jgi:hypothetical protein|nr:MAG TPA: hypothetical protein [Caudoviricetes sp.]DAR83039.1 MAG TPA: hypothetical protein [Caudoviricetes sp.]